jgi:hypothetical protein
MLLESIDIKTIPIRWEPWTEEELELFFIEYSNEQEEKSREVNYELSAK